MINNYRTSYCCVFQITENTRLSTLHPLNGGLNDKLFNFTFQVIAGNGVSHLASDQEAAEVQVRTHEAGNTFKRNFLKN